MAKSHLLWLTKTASGRYTITRFKPVRGRIKGTKISEMESSFDPLVFPNMCEASVIKLAGSPLGHLETRRILMTVEYIPEKGT